MTTHVTRLYVCMVTVGKTVPVQS